MFVDRFLYQRNWGFDEGIRDCGTQTPYHKGRALNLCENGLPASFETKVDGEAELEWEKIRD